LQRHLDPSPFELNTPFSIERASQPELDVNYIRSPFRSTTSKLQKEKEKPGKMSTQPEHPALMIPGPIEFDDAVLQAMSHYR
jgi:alanine-glyoxylate transaminase/serine-glyoxylate transaminase/serine-pyruvate transaminase